MNGLNDALTIGIVLTLVFGALFFYLYSRMNQVEKRVGLTENILLDLKMATENTLLSMSHPDHGSHEEVRHIEAIGAPTPLAKEEVEALAEEDFYKSVLQGVQGKDAVTAAGGASPSETTVAALEPVPGDATTASAAASSARVDVNYESMTLKELKALAKQRGVNVSATAHKKDIIDSLKRTTSGRNPTPLDNFPGGGDAAEEGFPVEVDSTTA